MNVGTVGGSGRHGHDVHAPVFRDEYVIDFDVVASGAGHSIRVPRIDQLDIASGEREEPNLGQTVWLRWEDDAHKDPVGVDDSRAPLPAPRNSVATRFRSGLASWRQAGRGQEMRLFGVEDFLKGFWELAQHPVVLDVKSGDPGHGGVPLAEGKTDFEEMVEIQLQSPVDTRDHDVEETRLTEGFNHLIGGLASLLGRSSMGPEEWGQFSRALHHRVIVQVHGGGG